MGYKNHFMLWDRSLESL